MEFRVNGIKINVRVTSGAALVTDWMDLDTLVAAQLREIARVLGSQGYPAEPDIGPGGTQGEPHPGNIETFSLIFKEFSEISGF